MVTAFELSFRTWATKPLPACCMRPAAIFENDVYPNKVHSNLGGSVLHLLRFVDLLPAEQPRLTVVAFAKERYAPQLLEYVTEMPKEIRRDRSSSYLVCTNVRIKVHRV
jgi:hypothetical protein